jgi:hypothetical protein
MINPCKQNHPCATRKQKGESRNSYGMRHKRVQSFRKLEQATRAMTTAGGSGFNPRMRTPEKGRNSQWTNQDRPSRRTIDGHPICNNCGNPGNIARNCRKGKGCFNCGDPENFSRKFPKRKQDGGSTNKQDPKDSSQKPTNSPARQSN